MAPFPEEPEAWARAGRTEGVGREPSELPGLSQGGGGNRAHSRGSLLPDPEQRRLGGIMAAAGASGHGARIIGRAPVAVGGSWNREAQVETRPWCVPALSFAAAVDLKGLSVSAPFPSPPYPPPVPVPAIRGWNPPNFPEDPLRSLNPPDALCWEDHSFPRAQGQRAASVDAGHGVLGLRRGVGLWNCGAPDLEVGAGR